MEHPGGRWVAGRWAVGFIALWGWEAGVYVSVWVTEDGKVRAAFLEMGTW